MHLYTCRPTAVKRVMINTLNLTAYPLNVRLLKLQLLQILLRILHIKSSLPPKRWNYSGGFLYVFFKFFFLKTSSLLLWFFMWYWSSCSSWKVAPHRSQGWGLSRAWVRRTWLSCAACEAKAFPQCLHLKGRSPECWRMCVRRILEAVKAWRRKGKKKNSQCYIFVFLLG